MKVDLGTIEVTDEFRRALRNHVGDSGLATRQEIRSWALTVVDCWIQDLVAELNNKE